MPISQFMVQEHVHYDVVGVLLAGFLAYELGKSMLETKGFFWAWFIHFLRDVLIFTFLAMGAVTHGGAWCLSRG